MIRPSGLSGQRSSDLVPVLLDPHPGYLLTPDQRRVVESRMVEEQDQPDETQIERSAGKQPSDDNAQAEAKPTPGQSLGDTAGGDEATGAGPSGGADIDTGGGDTGAEATGAGPSGGADT